jgi:hypothetical protein
MQAIKEVAARAGDLDREIFMGVVTDNSLGDALSVTVIATGLPGGNGRVVAMPRAKPVEAAIISLERAGVMTELEHTPGVAEFREGAGLIQTSPAAAGDTEEMAASADGFGYAPLISKAVWQTPAYLRRRSKPAAAETPVTVTRLKRSPSRDRGVESQYSDGALAVKNRYRQPLYSLG